MSRELDNKVKLERTLQKHWNSDKQNHSNETSKTKSN